jgi:hypothetical protein
MNSEWRKSSYSSNGAQCIEVATWRKSSYSSSGAQCIEVATADAVLIRDTTNRAGVTLSVPASAWSAFVGELRATALPAESHNRGGPIRGSGLFGVTVRVASRYDAPRRP